MSIAVFHHIGYPTPDMFTNSIEQIRSYEGVVTFDGVYESVFQHRIALPNHCILFVSGNQIGREGFCNMEQLLELQRLGHTLAWHGWSHTPLVDLGVEEIGAELSRPSWAYPYYAYPHGQFGPIAISVLKALGYEKAFSTTQGNDDDYSLYRAYIEG